MSSFFDVPAGLLFVLWLAVPQSGAVAPDAMFSAHKDDIAFAGDNRSCRFGEQAWLSALHRGAGGETLAAVSHRIFRTSSGRYYVPVASDRAWIRNLSGDGDLVCFVALTTAVANARHLEQVIGRKVRLDELYLAHLFGPEIVANVIVSAREHPDNLVRLAFPAMIGAEPMLFASLDDDITIGEFLQLIRATIAATRHPVPGDQFLRPQQYAREGQLAPSAAEVGTASALERTGSGDLALPGDVGWPTTVIIR